jgi:hypothetical protein
MHEPVAKKIHHNGTKGTKKRRPQMNMEEH